MYLKSSSRLVVASCDVTSARLAMKSRSALELFKDESLGIPLYLSRLGVGCAERVANTGYARESEEYKKFMEALDFILFAISYANYCRFPHIDESDLEAEIEKLGGSNYRTQEFRSRFDQVKSPDFLSGFDLETLSLSDYSQRVLMAIVCVLVDAIGKSSKHRLSISAGDITFADNNKEDEIIDAIEVLTHSSEEFTIWMHRSIDDCVRAFCDDHNHNPVDEGVIYLDIFNFFLKVIWSAYESRLPRLTMTFEPRLQNMGEEDILWRRLGSYFDPISSDDFLELLHGKTRRLHIFSRCHFLNVASMIMEAWHKEVSCP